MRVVRLVILLELQPIHELQSSLGSTWNQCSTSAHHIFRTSTYLFCIQSPAHAHNYCYTHQPMLIFRSMLKHTFRGICSCPDSTFHLFSSQGVILSYAIFLTRSLTLDWRDRAIRVLPVFVFPALVFLVYGGCARFTRMSTSRIS